MMDDLRSILIGTIILFLTKIVMDIFLYLRNLLHIINYSKRISWQEDVIYFVVCFIAAFIIIKGF